MSSKACGEPSLLLSTSILHALRMAVQAARSELACLTCAPQRVLPSAPAASAASLGREAQHARGRFSLLLDALNGVASGGAPCATIGNGNDAAGRVRRKSRADRCLAMCC